MNFNSVVLWVQHVIMPVVMETATSFGLPIFLLCFSFPQKLLVAGWRRIANDAA
jgi:hypothetical protein